jgi:hypothetical protein
MTYCSLIWINHEQQDDEPASGPEKPSKFWRTVSTSGTLPRIRSNPRRNPRSPRSHRDATEPAAAATTAAATPAATKAANKPATAATTEAAAPAATSATTASAGELHAAAIVFPYRKHGAWRD